MPPYQSSCDLDKCWQLGYIDHKLIMVLGRSYDEYLFSAGGKGPGGHKTAHWRIGHCLFFYHTIAILRNGSGAWGREAGIQEIRT